MDLLEIILLIISFVIFLCFAYARNPNNSGLPPNLPPGPKPYPIIGNILELGKKPHQSLTKLSKIYGPLMSLKLGSMTTVVVSSPEIAKIVLQKYDQIFSSRTISSVIRAVDHQKYSIGWLPINNNWRKLRKICKEHMFSVPKLDASQEQRIEKLRNLWNYVEECCITGQVVDIGRAAFTTSLNLMTATLFSMEITKFGSSLDFKYMMREMSELLGKPNYADYFPVLERADLQGLSQKMKISFDNFFTLFDEIIDQRLKSRRMSGVYASKNDLLEALLDLNQKTENEMSFDDIKHLLLDLFIAGTDTSANTVEWALAELLHNPEIMLKAKDELRKTILKGQQIQESDISRLPYLQAVIKETFRLHPVVPLLLPHKAEEDAEIDGYIIPKDTQVLVNVWAIGRDSSIWSNPDLFMPERFLEQETEFRGQHFELIPFGAGRRICPGLPLAYRMIHLTVATLLHNFEWKLESGLEPGKIDMNERFGLTLQKVTPLKAVPVKPM